MSDADRALVAALRAELAAIDPTRACDRAAERAGLEGGTRRDDPIIGRLLRRLARLDAAQASSGAPSGAVVDGRGTIGGPVDRVDPDGVAERITLDRIALDDAAWERLAEHCHLAWLRGRFLGRGSLSVVAGRTHLEFVVAPAEAPALARRMASLGLPASWRIRRGRGVVTWKSAETVATFLGRIGAGSSLLELEARQVSRTLRGELNRVLNAESANVARSVGAAGRQLAAIRCLAEDGRLAEQPHTVRLVAEGRREAPEATLAELADRLGVHRSAVQRALERLERLALHGDPSRRRKASDRGGSRAAAGEAPAPLA